MWKRRRWGRVPLLKSLQEELLSGSVVALPCIFAHFQLGRATGTPATRGRPHCLHLAGWQPVHIFIWLLAHVGVRQQLACSYPTFSETFLQLFQCLGPVGVELCDERA